MKKYIISSALIVTIALLVASGLIGSHAADASVGQGGQYQSVQFAPSQTNTSYLQSTIVASAQPSTTTALGGGGTFGSLVITGANTGILTVYDATTSNATLRTTSATTSLRVLAQFPASTAAGTYTFDEIYVYGIVAEWSGSPATSTLTYRTY